MSYEMQDVVQESPAAQALESGSLFAEAYSMSAQQFSGADRGLNGARSGVSQTFGALELFDSSAANKVGGATDAGVKSPAGKTEKIDAAVIENEDGSMDLEYADGSRTHMSKDGERVLEFDKEGRQINDTNQDPNDFNKDGKLTGDGPIGPPPPPEQIKRAVDDLLQRGVLPDIEFFEKRPVPRDDGEIRQRQEPDGNGGVRTTTEYPNGMTVAKVQQTVRGDDGRLTKVEETSIKGPEGFKESPKGTYVDKTGKLLAKESEDGTLTVFLDDHGKQRTVTEFPNGVRTTIGDPQTIVKDGKVVQFGRKTDMPDGSAQTADGTWIDKAGKPIMKENADGTVTIFSADGTYTQSADGKVTFKKQEPPAKKK